MKSARLALLVAAFLFLGSVNACAQRESAPVVFAVNAPVSSIALLTPSEAVAGSVTFVLQVDGANLFPSSVVRWDGSDLPTTWISKSQLTADVDAALVAAEGTAAVTVFTSAPGGGESAVTVFTITALGPVITLLVPDNSLAGDPSFSVTVQGTGFKSDSIVRWEGSDRVTQFISDVELSVDVTAIDIDLPGLFNVTVFNPGGPIVDLFWDASPSQVDGYNAYRSLQTGGPYTKLNSQLVLALLYTDLTTERGKSYFYIVRAVKGTPPLESLGSNEARADIPTEVAENVLGVN